MDRTRLSRRLTWPLALMSTALIAAVLLSISVSALTQLQPAPNPPTPKPLQDDNVGPAPASIGTDIPLTYFGPSPSQVKKELIGPYQLLKSGQLDTEAGTITLPLYRGRLKDGRKVWYILTDTTDKTNAEALGLNHAAKLSYSETGKAVRSGTLLKDGTLIFDDGAVDFRPEHRIVPGDAPNFFPPKVAEPGAVGDADYTPLVRITNSGNHIYNAPVLAFAVDAAQINFCDGNPDYRRVADVVVKICPNQPENGGGTATVRLTPNFSFARPVLYMTTEASDRMAAAMGGAIYTPALSDLGVGRDDSFSSAVERLFQITNGPLGKDNPQRQGLNSKLGDPPGADGKPLHPLNVIGGIPTISTDYSPLWDINLGEWTPEAVRLGYRARVFEEFNILGLVQNGWITGPGGKKFGSNGIVVNCPIVHRFL
ncbi:MAG TPA: hypothetical protein VNJ02_08180 [Vicinamibacterales bacterium]|nr:hypothetical protein [Vicinamibacterales bacterium]